MTRITLLLLAIAAVAIARRRLRFAVPLEPDPYAEPVPMTWLADTRNATTIRYLHVRAVDGGSWVVPTGVRSSMN